MQKLNKKNYKIKEAIAYYILGLNKYNEEIKDIKKEHWVIILKFILELTRDEVNTKNTIIENKEILDKIPFSWELTSDDLVAYATCIFYVLTNREKEITAEKIVTEFLSEIHSHHPRRTMKEANLILDQFFPDLKD